MSEDRDVNQRAYDALYLVRQNIRDDAESNGNLDIYINAVSAHTAALAARLAAAEHDHCAICDAELAGEHDCATATPWAAERTARLAAAERDRDEARQAWRAANDRLAELTRVDHLATPEGKAEDD